MDDNTLKELKQLIDEVMYATTKKNAKIPIKRLEFMASQLDGIIRRIDPYLSGKLSQVISYAKEASGNDNSKQHYIYLAKRDWHTFEHGVKYKDE